MARIRTSIAPAAPNPISNSHATKQEESALIYKRRNSFPVDALTDPVMICHQRMIRARRVHCSWAIWIDHWHARRFIPSLKSLATFWSAISNRSDFRIIRNCFESIFYSGKNLTIWLLIKMSKIRDLMKCFVFVEYIPKLGQNKIREKNNSGAKCKPLKLWLRQVSRSEHGVEGETGNEWQSAPSQPDSRWVGTARPVESALDWWIRAWSDYQSVATRV